LTFIFAGSEGCLIPNRGFRRDTSPTWRIQSSTKNSEFDKARPKERSRRSQAKAIEAKRFKFKPETVSSSGNVGTSGCPRWRKCWSWD